MTEERDAAAFASHGTEWFGTIISPPTKEEENNIFGAIAPPSTSNRGTDSIDKSGASCFPSPIGPRPKASQPVQLTNTFFTGSNTSRGGGHHLGASQQEDRKYPSEVYLKDWMQHVMKRRADASLIQLFVRRLEDKARCITLQDLVSNKKNLTFEYLQQLGFQREHSDCLMAALATYTSM
jgi:hypothetical protein